MVNTTGFYKAKDGRYVSLDPATKTISLSETEPSIRLRLNKDFWLSQDDGKVGKYGNPDQVKVNVKGTLYRVWVEQRGPDQFGLIPTKEDGEYSNTFLSTREGDFSIADDWSSTEQFVVVK